MTRKTSKATQDKAANPADPDAEISKQGASSEEAKALETQEKATAKTTARMVDAVLKTRHCSGGLCKEAGDTMRMTQGEYDRLKKYGRVE